MFVLYFVLMNLVFVKFVCKCGDGEEEFFFKKVSIVIEVIFEDFCIMCSV